MIKRSKNKSQSGFTLIEVLLALVLGVIVMGLAFDFYSQGQMIYTKAQKQVDAQSQLRLAMIHIKRELSVAINVEIADAPALGSYEVGFFYFYVNDNTMVIQDGTASPKALPGCLPLSGFKAYFSISPHKSNMVRVHMMSAEGVELNSDILIQNTGARAILGDTTERTTIKFKRIN